jgi:hypothetical protein
VNNGQEQAYQGELLGGNVTDQPPYTPGVLEDLAERHLGFPAVEQARRKPGAAGQVK